MKIKKEEHRKKRKIKLWMWGLIIPVSLLLAGMSFLYFVQDSQIFFPSYNEDAEAYLSSKEEYVKIDFSGTNLSAYSGWMHKGAYESAPALLIFNGAKGTAADLFVEFETSYDCWDIFRGFQVVCIDYPGYGSSSGEINEAEVYEMALEVYDYLGEINLIQSDSVTVMGYSLGTAPATYLAANRDVEGLILLAPFNNGTSLLNSYFNIFYGPLRFLVKNPFEQDLYANEVETETLIIASRDDEKVPYELSVSLEESFNSHVKFVSLNNVFHEEFWSNVAVQEFIKEFLEELR